MKTTNPFVYGVVVEGEHFADREEELIQLVSDLESGQNVILYSPRRYGKTSLILRVLEELERRKVIGIYVDLFRATSKARFVQIYGSALAKATSTKLDEMLRAFKEWIPRLVPKVVIKPEGAPDIEFDVSFSKADLDEILMELYEAPQRIAKRRGERVVVVFDEFQEIRNLDSDAMERDMRSVFQHHDRVGYVFMGSRRHLLDEIFTRKERPFYRIGKPFALGKIPREAFADFIRRRFKETGVELAEESLKEILHTTQCHPYYTQQLCHEAWNIGRNTGSVRSTEVRAAISRVVNAQSHAYTTLWESLSQKQKAMMVAIVDQGGHRLFSWEFLQKYSLGPPATAQRVLQGLERKGVVERENGEWVCTDPFLVLWIRRAILLG